MHRSASAVHVRDKGMLGYKKITRQILTCSAVEVQGSAKTRLELYGSVRIRMKINTGTRQEYRFTALSLHGKAVTRLSRRSMVV